MYDIAHIAVSQENLGAVPYRPKLIQRRSLNAQRNLAFGESKILGTIAIILFILWALGMASSYTMGGWVHILLVVAMVVILIRVIQGRRI